MLGCLGKVPPDRFLFNVSDYIIQQQVIYERSAVSVAQLHDFVRSKLDFVELIPLARTTLTELAYMSIWNEDSGEFERLFTD